MSIRIVISCWESSLKTRRLVEPLSICLHRVIIGTISLVDISQINPPSPIAHQVNHLFDDHHRHLFALLVNIVFQKSEMKDSAAFDEQRIDLKSSGSSLERTRDWFLHSLSRSPPVRREKRRNQRTGSIILCLFLFRRLRRMFREERARMRTASSPNILIETKEKYRVSLSPGLKTDSRGR